jgi:ribulose 1,5-bisphosphate synthetase/thiazole synthase
VGRDERLRFCDDRIDTCPINSGAAMAEFDAVVAGAGSNGLAAALRLAEAG